MKKLAFLLSFAPFLSFGQDSLSLKKYCPKWLGQEGALCFAYAPVYTALSIAHNVATHQTDENSPSFNVFSYGFVASKIKKEKSIFGKIFNKCGRNATVDLALGVLLSSGTVPYASFPQNCDCSSVDDLISDAEQYRIKDTTIIGDENTAVEIHVSRIKAALGQLKPVVIAIYQESFFYENRDYAFIFPDTYQRNKRSANHVICIVGFNDSVNGGAFLVKNNYTNWGQSGFAYIRYTDMIKLIRGSYIFNI